MAASSFKDQGNKEYKEGNWLKAAALYSKGLKEDPKNAVLLSNRSAALLKLNKVQKALADAEECIQINDSWDKGHYRKGNILEATKQYKQDLEGHASLVLRDDGVKLPKRSLEAYQAALRCNPENKEVAGKVKALTRLVQSPASQNASQNGVHKPASNGAAIASMEQYSSAKGSLAKGGLIPQSAKRTEAFFRKILELVEVEIQQKTFDRTFPSVYFLPGRLNEEGEEQTGQVSVQSAFDSPDTLANATAFLRQYAEDTAAQAAVTVAPRHKIAFPQVWQKSGWPHGKMDGIFVQMQSQGGASKLFFIPLGQKQRDPLPLKDKFSVVESLFR